MRSNASNVLLLCAKYNRPADGPYLTNDIADALTKLGCQIHVIDVEWGAKPGSIEQYVEANGVRVLRIGPAGLNSPVGLINLLYKWAFSSRRAMRLAKKFLANEQIDFVVAFAPVVTVSSVFRWAWRRFNPASYQYNADFFPFYHYSNGSLPGGIIFNLAYRAELSLMRRFDVIGCMSPANVVFLKDHFPLRAEQQVAILPLWADAFIPERKDPDLIRARHSLPPGQPIALFGGQLIEGRGIDDVLAAAELAEKAGMNIVFLFIGEGRLRPKIEEAITAGATNIILRAPVPRDEYLELASACDVGINATARHVIVPTFPTKTIDYLRALLPIAASVEDSSDYGEFIDSNGVGFTATAGQPAELLQSIRRCAEELKGSSSFEAAARATLETHFDKDKAAASILADLTH